MRYDVLIIGGGAAGLMCAMEAGKRGRRVLVIEHANRVGKKILISGGGRCNFTNLHVTPDSFLSSNPHFCKSALARYTQWYDGDVVAGALSAVLALAVAGLALMKPLQPRAVATFGVLAGLFTTVTIGGVLPQMSQFFLSRRIAAAVAAHGATSRPVALAEFHEPSAVFLLGTQTVLTDLSAVPAHLGKSDSLAVVPVNRLDELRAALAAEGRTLEQLDEIDGFNYSRGRWLRLALISARTP